MKKALINRSLDGEGILEVFVVIIMNEIGLNETII